MKTIILIVITFGIFLASIGIWGELEEINKSNQEAQQIIESWPTE